MKRFITSALVGSLITAGTAAWSYTKPLHDYSSTLHPSASSSSLLHPPTDITVVNASSNYIYAVIPNSPVNDYIRPGYNDHIYNYDSSVWWTYLVLQDTYRTSFYAQNVCPLSIVTVYGYTGHFTVNTDSDLCN